MQKPTKPPIHFIIPSPPPSPTKQCSPLRRSILSLLLLHLLPCRENHLLSPPLQPLCTRILITAPTPTLLRLLLLLLARYSLLPLAAYSSLQIVSRDQILLVRSCCRLVLRTHAHRWRLLRSA